MAIPTWKPSTIYLPGALVIPTTTPGAVSTTIPNSDFEGGDTGWTKGTGWAINTNDAFAGTYSAEYSGPGVANLISTTKVAIAPGKAITAKCFIQHGASAAGGANAAIMLQWYDAVDAPLPASIGNYVSDGAAGIWKESTISAVAPAGAASVSVGATGNNDFTPLWVDNFQWNYIQGAAAPALVFKSVGATAGPYTDVAFVDNDPTADTITRLSGSWLSDGLKIGDGITISGSASNDATWVIEAVSALVITLTAAAVLVAEAAGASVTISAKATQGTSGSEEPTWPGTSGNTVVDNDILWEAAESNTVTWEASPILLSGVSEPTWPEESGSYVSDGTIAWKTVPLRIEDERCPHTKVVAIAASKVFAGGVTGDIVRFCATLNPRDWTTEDDAGFLPSGLQQKGQVGVDAMGVYRGNLAVWSASTFQVWQVDPDPAAMALLDAMEGIGSIYQQAVQPVSNDLFFLAALGVRTVSIAAGSNNLGTGDAGVPIDTLIQAAVTPDVEPIATYYPSAGQYWLAFRALTIPVLAAGTFLLTTTVYPIEAIDGMDLSCSLKSARMWRLVDEEYDVGIGALDGAVTSILQALPLEDEQYDVVIDPRDGSVTAILQTLPPEDEQYDAGIEALDGNVQDQLVKADMPDEGLDFTIALKSATMTAV